MSPQERRERRLLAAVPGLYEHVVMHAMGMPAERRQAMVHALANCLRRDMKDEMRRGLIRLATRS